MFSHDTALSILGLGDLIPSSVHLTIPESSRPGPRVGLGLRRSRSAAMTDRHLRDGLWVSTAVRALPDTAEVGGDPDRMRSAAELRVERRLCRREEVAIARLATGGAAHNGTGAPQPRDECHVRRS